MTAARSLSDPVSPWPLAVAANDGGSALGTTCGGFSGTAVGDDRLGADERLAVAPLCVAVVGATETGAASFARLVALWPDGSAYTGDLWLDILEYRELRMRGLGTLHLGDGPDARLSTLEHRLHARADNGARLFTRFLCHSPTRLTAVVRSAASSSTEPIDVFLIDVSAGGAKLDRRRSANGAPRPAALVEGAEVELQVEDAGGPLNMVLPSRVVWLRGDSFGIMFAGAPRKAR